MKISVGVSNRHVHLCRKDLDILFGKDYELIVGNKLTQANDFASTDKVTIKTNKNVIEGVRVLGPLRNYTQVEITRTDAYRLGVNPPVRESGDLNGSEPITIIGPVGQVDLKEGCIIASRHIHINSEELIKYNLDVNKKYRVKVGGIKGGILDNVSLKARKDYSWELHLDTDDANGFLINQCDEVELIMEEE